MSSGGNVEFLRLSGILLGGHENLVSLGVKVCVKWCVKFMRFVRITVYVFVHGAGSIGCKRVLA